MLVKGHSGFSIELVDERTIRKSAQGAGAARLERQIQKQVHFREQLQQEHVRTPRVIRTERTESSFQAEMEFIVARDFIQFLSEADRGALDRFLEIITEYVRRNIAASREVDVTTEVQAKLAELEKRNVPAKFIAAARSRCIQPVHVPVGLCHGDLTLSNILFKNDGLYLLDFLDSFVESPLQDVVKLRQDTCFGWSLQLYQGEFNRPKIQITLRYLDQRLEAVFREYEWQVRHYELFQLVSLMRVLPYCETADTAALITGSLDQMLSESVA